MTSALAKQRSSNFCLPRWGTPRIPSRPTLGPQVANVANLLGTPLMPWQRHVADVALEVDPATGLLAYREVGLTVPRQSGKTLLLLCLMVHRALGFNTRQRILYTAQTRMDARKKWEDEHLRVLRDSPFAGMFTPRMQNGSEAFIWNNGSMHSLVSVTKKSGHGETLDLGVIDEAFAQVDARLEQAMKPAMITRSQPQLWVVSTAGTDESVFLRAKVDAGRARCDLGVTDSVAYFEWSAPEDVDPGDPRTWQQCMPALHRPSCLPDCRDHTVVERAIEAEFASMEAPEFRRAFLNQWPDVFPIDAVIDLAAWKKLADPRSQLVDPVALAADVTPARTSASIAAAGVRQDGLPHVEVVEVGHGTEWVVPKLLEMYGEHKPIAVVVDGAGPAGSLIAPLEAQGIEVLKPTARDAAQACGQFYDAAIQGRLRHLDQAPLNAALAGAKRRDLGDAWAWARKSAGIDISPLVAVTLALWGHTTKAHLYDEYDVLDSVA